MLEKLRSLFKRRPEPPPDPVLPTPRPPEWVWRFVPVRPIRVPSHGSMRLVGISDDFIGKKFRCPGCNGHKVEAIRHQSIPATCSLCDGTGLFIPKGSTIESEAVVYDGQFDGGNVASLKVVDRVPGVWMYTSTS